MKFIYISISCFLVVLLLCSYSANCVIQKVQETVDILESAVQADALEEKEHSLKIIKEAHASWESHQLFFGTVLRHDEIDNVIEEFARLESYASTEDQDDFISNCKALLARLKHIQEMERPILQNIM